MNVLLASPLFYPVFTGAGTRFQRYAPGLRARGIQLRVLAGGQAQEVSTSEIAECTALNELPVQRIELPGKTSIQREVQYAQALLKYCRKPESRPDLIHLLTSSLSWFPFHLAFRRLGIPIILSHTLLGKMSSKGWKKSLQKVYWRLPFELADCIVTQSMVGRDALRNLGLVARIEVIPNGVDLRRFRPVASTAEKRKLRSSLGLPLDAEIVLFVGSLTKRKGIDLLLAAWVKISAKRSNAYLVLVGPRASEMHQTPRNINEQSGLDLLLSSAVTSNNILLPGWVNNVEDYFKIADLFVLPSIREGMPNVLLEAYACGLACVVTPFLGLSQELGIAGEQYMLTDREPDNLAGMIEEILDKEPLRKKLGVRARQWVEEKLSTEISLDHYATLYHELLAED